MPELPRVFISHADRELAIALDELIRRAFPNRLRAFNASQIASGLGAGALIDRSLVTQVRQANALVWLATPRAAHSSFWMAWELGVANALEIPVIPCRALGLTVSQLPQVLPMFVAPDLGSNDGIYEVLRAVGQALDIGGEPRAEAIDESRDLVSMFYATRVRGIVHVVVRGEFLLIENLTGEQLTDLSPSRAWLAEAEQLAAAIAPGLRSLEPAERLAVRVVPEVLKTLASVEVEWISSVNGRQVERVTLARDDTLVRK